MGPIKIGTTTNWARDRISALQTGNPVEMQLIVWIPGGEETEAAMHERFAHLRIRGEWFKPGLALLQFIDDVEKGVVRAKTIARDRNRPEPLPERTPERQAEVEAGARSILIAMGMRSPDDSPPIVAPLSKPVWRAADLLAEIASLKADNAKLREQLQRLDDERDCA
jgi:hypothetical protein